MYYTCVGTISGVPVLDLKNLRITCDFGVRLRMTGVFDRCRRRIQRGQQPEHADVRYTVQREPTGPGNVGNEGDV